MKNLLKLEPLSIDKRKELVNEFVNTRIISQIDDVKKISINHLIFAFEIFLIEKFDLPLRTVTFEFMNELEPVMNKIGYFYKGKGYKIVFNDITKPELEYDRVINALHLENTTIMIDSHRYFEKLSS